MANPLLNARRIKKVNNFNHKLEDQREVFAKLDTVMAVLEQLPDFVESTMDSITFNSFKFSESPLGFLFNIIYALGISEESLRAFITEMLVKALPAVEVGVKASLLTNLKKLVSCNSDPRIPMYMRKKVSYNIYTNILRGDDDKRGIDISVDAIDPDKILDMSPFVSPGMFYYFGCVSDSVYDNVKKKEEKEDSYWVDSDEIEEVLTLGPANSMIAKLVRADDFNAFLWYVIHKGNKLNPIKVNIGTNEGFKTFDVEGDEETYYITSNNSNMLGKIDVIVADHHKSNIIAGTTFYDAKNPGHISMCVHSLVEDDGVTVTGNTIVPISSEWFGCNWYVDKSNYYSNNIKSPSTVNKEKSIKKKRDYDKDKAICNLRYFTPGEKSDAILPNCIRFSILPKPYVIGLTRILFDANGTPNSRGRFSFDIERQNSIVVSEETDEEVIYDVYDDKNILSAKLKYDKETHSYNLFDVTNLGGILVECYPGLSVYEFNYDYVMGMKLFDPKVICQKIFNNAANPAYDATFTINLNKTKDPNRYPYLGGKQRILEIVNRIIEEDDEDINDCFYKFSNEQYDEMLKKTEEIRYRQLPYNQGYNNGKPVDFSSVNAILMEYPDNGTLEEQMDVINRSISQACAVVTDRPNITALSDSSTTKIDFLTNVLKQLAAALIDALLSPKVLMLLTVNYELMGKNTNEALTTDTLLRIGGNIIASVIREIRDLIIKQLLDYICQQLLPLKIQMEDRIRTEQYAAYAELIKNLLRFFNRTKIRAERANAILSSFDSRFGDSYSQTSGIDLPTELDNVNYADIYPTDKKETEPIIEKCD